MSSFPEELRRYLELLVESRYRPAYLGIDGKGTVSSMGGTLASLGLGHIQAGDLADEIDCLHGLLPIEGSLSLPWVELEGGQVVDIHLVVGNACTWVVFLDAAHEVQVELKSQQFIYDANALREGLANSPPSRAIAPQSEELIAQVMTQLDTVILVYHDNHTVDLIGRPPQWIYEIYPKSFVQTKNLEPWSRFLFLSDFIREAKSFWEKPSRSALRSGLWTESDWLGEDLLLEARALLIQGTKLILITRFDFGDERVKLYRAREVELERVRKFKEGERRTRALEEKTEILEAEVQQKSNQLVGFNDRLESQNKRLSLSRAKLRSLAFELTQAEERERRRIAQGLHDHIGQMLASIKIRLGTYRQRPGVDTDKERASEIERIYESLSEVIRFTRSLTFELGSPILYEFGFIAAVQDLLDRMGRDHGWDVELHDEIEGKIDDDELKVTLFQTVRELLHNIVKHADATRVIIRCKDVDRCLVLSVEDNGKGFDVERVHPESLDGSGFGLFSVQDRLDFFGGTFEARSAPDQGTRITIRVPWSPRASAPLNPR